ncbi:MAG TPA: hypothetical protein VGM88_01385 [Kofleriaceae bacterium]|jgi:anti-sigma factor RsiW
MKRDLLAAYVDGVSELSPDERRDIEAALADDEALRADADATRELLGALRALPAEGSEPDYGALARRIAAAVGDRVPRPWWKTWKLSVPLGAFAAAAAAAIVWVHVTAAPHPVVAVEKPVHVAPAPVTPEATPAVAIYLDGESLDVEDPDSVLQALDDDDGDDDDGMLPASDLAWVDKLDDAAMDRVEAKLDAMAKKAAH